MFGRQSGLNTTGSSSNLVEFKAGRMNMIGKMVHPDARKGMVYMMQSEDGLMHFCWKDRGTGRVEDDLIVFPDDFEFKRVEQCKTGRVYVLKFKTSTRRMFFWMQEPKTDKDDEHCRRVNDLLNNPPSASRGGGGGGSDNNDLQYMLNNMSQQQLMQLFGGVGQMGGLSSLLGSMNRNSDSSRTPSSNRSGGFSSTLLTPENSSTTVPRTPSAPKGKTSRTNSSSNGGSSNNGGGGGGSSSDNGAGASRSLNIDLSTAIAGSDAVNQLITDPEASKLLSVHLPELDDNDETRKQQIKEHIQSPQFQQALTMFTTALQSAQLGPVVSQFELPADAISAAYSGNLEDFVKALEKALPEGATMQVDPPQEAAATGTATETTPAAASKEKETAVKPESEVSKSEDKKTEKTED